MFFGNWEKLITFWRIEMSELVKEIVSPQFVIELRKQGSNDPRVCVKLCISEKTKTGWNEDGPTFCSSWIKHLICLLEDAQRLMEESPNFEKREDAIMAYFQVKE